MSDGLASYWNIRLEALKEALEKNRFGAHVTQTASEAGKLVLKDILPNLKPRTISWGDSMTMTDTGILDALRKDKRYELIVTFDPNVPRPELLERRRQALLSDVFMTGSNAVTESGQLVNLDMVGNRVAGITFGPRNVILFIGRNKLVTDLDAAKDRIKNYAAPANIIRHDFKTPCAKTGKCMDCASPQRICNTWTVTEKSFPPGRIQIILINQDLGL